MVQTRAKSPFELNRGIENRYAMQLRALAGKIGHLVTSYSDPLNNPEQRFAITESLTAYADLITPWAQRLAGRVVKQVDWANKIAWNEHSRSMSRALQREIQTAPTGEVLRFMQAEQVQLIRSLPLEAAQRVKDIALKNLLNATRATQYAEEIMKTGDVTKSRANLIARTETSTISNNLTMSRAIYVGSEDYYWRTERDSNVRPSHRALEGALIKWVNPPTTDGLTYNAGCGPNCRCHSEPRILLH